MPISVGEYRAFHEELLAKYPNHNPRPDDLAAEIKAYLSVLSGFDKRDLTAAFIRAPSYSSAWFPSAGVLALLAKEAATSRRAAEPQPIAPSHPNTDREIREYYRQLPTIPTMQEAYIASSPNQFVKAAREMEIEIVNSGRDPCRIPPKEIGIKRARQLGELISVATEGKEIT